MNGLSQEGAAPIRCPASLAWPVPQVPARATLLELSSRVGPAAVKAAENVPVGIPEALQLTVAGDLHS